MAALKGEKRFNTFLTVLFAIISIFWVVPVLMVLINAFKLNYFVKTNTFALPFGEMWAGFLLILHHHRIHIPDSSLHFYECMVRIKSRLPDFQNSLLPLCILNGGTFPDGHVHSFPYCRHIEVQYSILHSNHLSWIRSRTCNLHFRRLCKERTPWNGRGSSH